MNLDQTIYKEIMQLEELPELDRCIQCGTCSGSCPLHAKMEYSPRALFALIRDYEVSEALRSNTMWYCVSCYLCTTRCPRQIPITSIMYRLKEISRKYNYIPNKIPVLDLYKAFNNSIRKSGKANESLIMREFGTKNPRVVFKNLKLGIELLRKKRFPLKNQKIKDARQMENLFQSP